jgi:hypothetical protein
MIAHISPAEALMLRQAGGAGTRNQQTGLPQFYVGGGPGGLAAGGDTETGRQATDRAAGGSSGYGNATGDRGSGLGAGGGHSGNNGLMNNSLPQVVYVQAPVAPPPTSNMPGPPVSTVPLMSTTAATNMTGGRFGAVPSWAETPYQIGTAPTSYPTPGVNTSLGLPGSPGASSTPAGSPGAPAPQTPPGTKMNAAGQLTNLRGIALPYQPNAYSTAKNIAPNAANAAVAQLLAAAGITPKPAAQPGPAPVSPLQQATLAALGLHPQAQQQPQAQAGPGGPMASPASFGGLGGLGGLPARPATPQPQQPAPVKPAAPQQSLLAALTGSGAPKKSAVPAKKPAGKTNR